MKSRKARAIFCSDLNSEPGFEGTHRCSIWSTVDEVVGGACKVWGRNTCQLPDQTGERAYQMQPYGHYGLRDLTGAVQQAMIERHEVL